MNYIGYGIKRFFRYFLLATLIGCVTYLPIFIYFILPTIVVFSLVLAIYDTIILSHTGVSLPSFGPMYYYLLSWGFMLAIVLFLTVLLISFLQGVL